MHVFEIINRKIFRGTLLPNTINQIRLKRMKNNVKGSEKLKFDGID